MSRPRIRKEIEEKVAWAVVEWWKRLSPHTNVWGPEVKDLLTKEPEAPQQKRS